MDSGKLLKTNKKVLSEELSKLHATDYMHIMGISAITWGAFSYSARSSRYPLVWTVPATFLAAIGALRVKLQK
jgi:hypothetical protein